VCTVDPIRKVTALSTLTTRPDYPLVNSHRVSYGFRVFQAAQIT
jgi:hypothetical protein